MCHPSPIVELDLDSLAPHFFLLDPDVGLLSGDDPVAQSTLDLATKQLDVPGFPGVITWHVSHLAHLGYGQGQLVMALLYLNQPERFRRYLKVWLDLARLDGGDVHLMQEVFPRAQPNRGNKAHLGVFPFIAAALANHRPGLIPDLVVQRPRDRERTNP